LFSVLTIHAAASYSKAANSALFDSKLSDTLHAGSSGDEGVQEKSGKTAKIADKRKKNDIDLGKILNLVNVNIRLMNNDIAARERDVMSSAKARCLQG
jgi:hypothetical protein